MMRVLGTALSVLLFISSTLSFSAATPRPVVAGITMIGQGFVSGAATDKSGLSGVICQAGAQANCVSKAIFGGFGSDVAYTGHDNVFVAAPDRGPFDGLTDVPYLDRIHFLHITTKSNLQSPPQAPTRKKIYKIDLTGATDVSGVNSLPAGALPIGIVPVTKTLFIDLLAPEFNLIPTIAEKIEGLAWGPDLEDGRHVLYVFSDNDLNPALASQIYSFAIDPELINLEHQFLPGPLYPPGQVKKAIQSNQY